MHGKKQQNVAEKVIWSQKQLKDDTGEVVLSGIHTYGETVHVFVERKNYNGIFMPGYQRMENRITIQQKRACYMLIIVWEMLAGTK